MKNIIRDNITYTWNVKILYMIIYHIYEMKNITHGNISHIQNEKKYYTWWYIYEVTKMSAITEKMEAKNVRKLPSLGRLNQLGENRDIILNFIIS